MSGNQQNMCIDEDAVDTEEETESDEKEPPLKVFKS